MEKRRIYEQVFEMLKTAITLSNSVDDMIGKGYFDGVYDEDLSRAGSNLCGIAVLLQDLMGATIARTLHENDKLSVINIE